MSDESDAFPFSSFESAGRPTPSRLAASVTVRSGGSTLDRIKAPGWRGGSSFMEGAYPVTRQKTTVRSRIAVQNHVRLPDRVPRQPPSSATRLEATGSWDGHQSSLRAETAPRRKGRLPNDLRRSRSRSATVARRQLRPSAAQLCADAGAPLDAGPGYSPSRRLAKSERARAIGARMSAFSGCSTTCRGGSGGRQFDPCPGAEARVSFGQ